ncbi:MAG: dTDP-glucose 4,6-dehydratase [Myxococcales bacterium]|nr:dTDP-glucose 4,6-dehydratase [Myxococcales bacterium]
MKILITGGAGFIGSNFLNRFVPRHPEHVFLNVDCLSYAANLKSLEAVSGLSNYRFVRADIADQGQVETLFREHEPELVIHFAAESHVDRSIAGPRAFVMANVVGTFNLLEAFRQLPDAGARLFHHVSTDEVYGSLGPEGFFTETTPYDPSSPYSASKAASDHFVRAFARTYGLRVRLTNCSNNYGPRQFPEKLIPLMILNLVERKPLPIYGQGLNVRDWLYVDDHSDAIWAVIHEGRDGETYNVGGNTERTNVAVVETLCRVVAAETGVEPDELLGLMHYVKDRPGHDLRYAIDASKLCDACGWQPAETFESGIHKTVRWYLDNDAWVQAVRSGEYRGWIEHNYGGRGAAAKDDA